MDGAFTALLLIICGVSSSAVPPPSHVTVSCQNLRIAVKWDYSEHQPPTVFRIDVRGSKGVKSFEANTTEHQYDLSPFVWESEDHFLAFLCVDVTAIQGDKRSEAVRSKSFSFSGLKSVDIKCVLDFPPVDVHVAEIGASASFQNPFRFYKDLKRTVKPDGSAELRFSVSSAANSFEGSCRATDSICRLDVTFPDGVEECVTLKGELFLDKLGVNQVGLKETEKLCSDGDPEDGPILVAALLVSIFVVVVIVAVIIICKVNAWTMDTLSPPKNLMSLVGSGKQQSFLARPADPETISPASVVGPNRSTSIGSEEDDCSEPLRASSSREFHPEDQHYSRRSLNIDQSDFMYEANKMDEEDSLKTESVSLSSSEEEPFAYDCPHVHQEDMGGGDMVNAYNQN